ncbi:MAG: NAD(P)H-dependent oxidoreductase [Candidatus Neomarinimicrobiota bacterium]|jgi:NAD(P)H-dependent FMN reductase
MKKILVFSGSNSSTSINQRLAVYAGNCLEDVELKVIHLKNFPAEVYSMDQELRGDFPETMLALNDIIKEVDGILISLPEYNSGITPVFKNSMDWISRIENPILKDKPICLLSTSPGARGGKTNLAYVSEVLIKCWGGKLTSTFSLPSFNDHLVDGTLELSDRESSELLEVLDEFMKHV